MILALWLGANVAHADIAYIPDRYYCSRLNSPCDANGTPGRCRQVKDRLRCVAEPVDTDHIPDLIAPDGTEQRPERDIQQPPHDLLAGAASPEPPPPEEPASCSCQAVTAPSTPLAGLLLLLLAARRR